MADEDGSGTVKFAEFAKKFSTWKGTSSIHRAGNKRVSEVTGVAVTAVAKYSEVRSNVTN